MGAVQLVSGVVQNYAWGDAAFIPAMLDVPPDGTPWAELWLGTHPGGEATVADGRPLGEVVGALPYLLKVLAAQEMLSLQTHPSREQAAAGFRRENEAGLALDDPRRIYSDPHPKPELLCALTPFDALCGFRPAETSAALMEHLGLVELAESLRRDGLEHLVHRIFREEIDLEQVVSACARHVYFEARQLMHMVRRHPGDSSVVVSLLLHHVHLSRGEAIFLGPGNLHAYLTGAGVEIMSASDNVIRGGMTTKHVDVDELLRVLDIRPISDPRIRPVEVEPGRWRYDTPDTPFRLWRWEVAGRFSHTATGRELVICVDGATDVLERGSTLVLMPGETLELAGIATLFRAEEVELPPTAP